MDRNQWLTEIARAIADGDAVDWVAVSHQATDPGDSEIIRRLQSIEQLVLAHGSTNDVRAQGTSWGSLQIIELLGAGAHGDVYRAYDARLDRDVALKLLRTNQNRSDSAVVAEARLMAKVRHPGVVVVHGADTIGGQTGIWMELIDGCSLAERVKRDGPFAADEIVRIGIDLCSAVTAINKAGLLHRDVKAQNVLLEKTGRVVVADFGTGQENAFTSKTSGADLAGTPTYLAPEVLAGGPHSPQSEVYALGALLHYIASGAFPVDGRSLAEIRQVHEAGQLVSTANASPALPVEIAATIDTALAGDISRRYQSARALRRALQSARTLRTQRLPGIILSVVGKAERRIAIAKTLVDASVANQYPTKNRLWSTLSHVRSATYVVWMLLIASLSEISRISWRWAVGAYVRFALLPSLTLILLSNQLPDVSIGPTAFVIVTIYQASNLWLRFLPLSFFYATALAPSSRRPPPAALAVAGTIFALALNVFLVNRSPEIHRLRDPRLVGFNPAWAAQPVQSVAAGRAVDGVVRRAARAAAQPVQSIATGRPQQTSSIAYWMAIDFVGLLLTIPSSVLLAAQLSRASKRRRLSVLLVTPAIYFVSHFVLGWWNHTPHALPVGRYLANWMVVGLSLTIVYLSTWIAASEEREEE